MSLFNKTIRNDAPQTTNFAGGQAFAASAELRVASLLLTSFAQDQFYRSAQNTFAELIGLLPQVDPKFAAQAAIFARNEYGMRSITHVLAAELAAHVSGQPWAKRFYDRIVHRPDDMLEILSYFRAKGGKHLPNAMRKGFSASFDRFDSYQLAKYKASDKSVKLVDIVNLVHPTPNDRNREALALLVKDALRNTETWEAKLSAAGQSVENEADKSEQKREVWATLLAERKLGYFALLRNLRNIAEQAPESLPLAIEQLKNPNSIRRSLVLPFRFLSALDAVKTLPTEQARALTEALNAAIETALANVPKLPGRTLVVVDDSGSMTSGQVRDFARTPIQLGALFAAALFKTNNADLMCFSDDARYVHFNPADALASIAERIVKGAKAAGTNFHAIFQTAKQRYDRVIVLSDMQGWMHGNAPTQSLLDYKQRYGANPFIYSFDLCGYGSLQFPQNQVYAVAGFSEKVFDLMALLESDPNALIHKIKSIEL